MFDSINAAARDGSEADRFRPDLEGLRAVAVVLVVLYHAAIPPFDGGFIGVDVFFVLSGFLITGLLLRELERSGTIALPAFYSRRARRLLPAALLVLAVTVVTAAAVLPPLQVPDVSNDAAAAALYVSNIRFAANATDYLRADLAPSPVLHYWSLGVEEQFYLFWPAIVLLVAGATRHPLGAARVAVARRRVAVAALAISALSLGLAIWLTGVDQPWAFFLLPARAWQLGVGALLALGTARLARLPAGLATVLGWGGVALVVFAGATLGGVPYPGTAALLPVVGSAFVIVAGLRRPSPGEGRRRAPLSRERPGVGPGRFAVGRLLGTGLPRFVGRISYSLYLWHWPVLILPAAAVGRSLTLPERLGLVAVAVGLATLTHVAIEDPLRRGRIVGTVVRRNLFTAGAVSLTVAIASLGIGVATLGGLQSHGRADPSAEAARLREALASAGANAASEAASEGAGDATAPAAGSSPTLGPAASATPGPPATRPPTVDRAVPPDLRPSLADAHADLPTPYGQGCNLGFGAVESPDCVYGNPKGSTTVVLFGDSHALSWFPAVDRVAQSRGWRLLNLTKSGCGSADVRQWLDALGREYTECAAWRSKTMQRIAAEHPALVILTNSRALAVVDSNGATLRGDDAIAPWQAGLERTEASLAGIGTRVAVIADTPRAGYDVPVCLSQHRDSILACATPLRDAVSAPWLAATAAATKAGGASLIDPAPWVCPTDPCPPVIANLLVYRDQQHLATPFSAALADYLGPALPAVP